MAQRDAGVLLDQILIECEHIQAALLAIATQIQTEKEVLAAEGKIEPETKPKAKSEWRVPGISKT